MAGVKDAVRKTKRAEIATGNCRHGTTCGGKAEFILRFGAANGDALDGDGPDEFRWHVCGKCLKYLLSRWTTDSAGHDSFIQVRKYGSPELNTGAGVR